MKKYLLTISTPNITEWCAEFIANQKAYADARGYEHVVSTELRWPDLHPSFSKVWEIYKVLRDDNVVIWADVDVAFMNQRVDLADLLVGDTFLAAYHQQNWDKWKYLCAGLTVWKANAQSMAFLDEWLKRCENRTQPDFPWEQWYLDEMIRETNYNNIRACTGPEIGCFATEIWHDGVIWDRSMPTVHFAGQQWTWETKCQAYLDKYKDLVITPRA